MHSKLISIIAATFILAACSGDDKESSVSDGSGSSTRDTNVSSQPIGGPAPGSQADLLANYGDRVFFDYDRYDLKPQARATIERWAEFLSLYGNMTITIQGHADERGTRDYNLALGNRRANATMEYLAALGVSGNRIDTVSFGKERPAVPGSSDAAYAQNRRGVVCIDQESRCGN